MTGHSKIVAAIVVGLAGCGGQSEPAPGTQAGSATTTGSDATAAHGSAGSAAPAGAAGATGAPLRVDPALVTGKLANGLTYYVLHNAKPEKRAELWLAVNAGSVLEDDDQRGIAHFVEHMAFNGTKKYARQEIVSWLEKIGMKFGADVNARTSFDDTVYQIEVPTDDASVIAHGLDVLHEWSQAVTFAPDRVEKERGVILEERRLGRGAGGRLLDTIVPRALPGSKYGQRIPIGLEPIIKTVTPETLKRFYRDWYRPDLMAVIVVGDVDASAIQKQIEAQFSDLKMPEAPKPRPDVAVPPHADTITITANDPELPITAVAIASTRPHVTPRTDTDARAVMVDLLFSSMMNQRFLELGKKETAPFVGVQVGKQPILRPIDVWFQAGIVKGDRAADTLAAIATESTRVAKFGFVDSEVARAKQDLLNQVEVAAKEKDKTESSDRVEELVRTFLTGEVFTAADDDLALARKLIPGISAAELQADASAAASEANRLVVAAGNASTKLPDQAALTAALAAGQRDAKAAYVDDAAAGPLVAKPPAAGTIASETKLADLGVTEWTLSNGVHVALKPTDFQNDNVSFAAALVGGSSLASDEDFIAADNADDIVEASGAGQLSAVQLHKALAGTGIEEQLIVTPTDELQLGSTQPDHLEQLLQLMYLRWSAPRSDPDAVAAWRAQQVAARKNQLDDPGTMFAATFQETASNHSLRARLQTSDDFAKLDVARSLAFYNARLAHLSGLHVTFVGSFSIDAIKPLVLTYLGGLPAGAAEKWSDPHIAPPNGPVSFDVAQGIEPKAAVHLWFHVAMPWTRQDDHDLNDLAAALAIRLREELREGLGGTYGVGVSGKFQREPQTIAGLDIQFGCAPENVEKLVAAAKKVIASFVKDGPPQIVVDKIKETEHRERETSLKKNEFWLQELAASYRHGEDPKHISSDAALIDAVTVERLKAAAVRYLGNDYVMGVLRSKPK